MESALEIQCKRLWQECMQKIWGKHCMWCKKYKPISGHHIIPRGYYLTKYELMNGVGICVECHNKIHGEAGAELEFAQYLDAEWPDLWLWHHRMRPKAKQAHGGWSEDELKEIKAELRRFLHDY